MHELKIIQDIFPVIEKVAGDNHLKSITKVILGVGEQRQVKNEFLQFAFDTLAKNSVAEGAELVINLIPVTVLCNSCQKKFEICDNIYVCPGCGGIDLDVLTGKEIVLESVDGDRE